MEEEKELYSLRMGSRCLGFNERIIFCSSLNFGFSYGLTGRFWIWNFFFLGIVFLLLPCLINQTGWETCYGLIRSSVSFSL